MPDISSEITFQTTRSGGKGGQNVNKVETAVIGNFDVVNSKILTAEQKRIVFQKLPNRINSEGFLVIRSQVFRGQLENKEEVIRKINEIVRNSLKKKKARIATRPSKQAKEKRLEIKKKKAEIKSSRKKFRSGEY